MGTVAGAWGCVCVQSDPQCVFAHRGRVQPRDRGVCYTNDLRVKVTELRVKQVGC